MYVSCSLLKKYETKQGDVYSQYVQYLGDMAVGDDILTYTGKWFDQVNRGGFFPLEIEKCVHQVVLPRRDLY